MSHKILMGCVADDFTGASDAASFLKKGGLKSVLYNGIPARNTPVPLDCQAVVIALKTRTQETEFAVEDALEAIRWLQGKGASKYYIKYCSTFDSTKEGNIGPIVDAAMEELNVKSTIICPALPINKRTVKNGVLYVDGIPLGESYMKNHPLTPMWESKIAKLIEPQGKYDCIEINHMKMYQDKKMIQEEINIFGKERKYFYIIPDYVEDNDASRIVELFGHMVLLTGGSGILTELAAYCLGKQSVDTIEISSKVEGKALILAGSCSVTTLSQVQRFKSTNRKAIKINPLELIKGSQTIEGIWDEILGNREKEILIYSSDTPKNVKQTQVAGKLKVADLLEQTMGTLAKRAVENGYTRIIVAGGETAGAITKKLGFDAYHIGKSVAPGVPILIPTACETIRLILKSGNFGDKDFFLDALAITRK